MKTRFWKVLLFTIVILSSTLFAQKAELVVQTGHSSPVESLAYSPDGRFLASAGNDVIIWDAETGRQLKTLATAFTETVSFSPDGKTLASGDRDGIYLWHAESGKLLKKLTTGDENIYENIAFTPDGKTLVSAGDNFKAGSVIFWNLETGDVRRKTEIKSVRGMALSPDGKTLALSVREKGISLWSTASGEQIKTFAGTEYETFSILFSPDGRKLFITRAEKPAAVINIETGELRPFGKIGESFRIALSPNGKILASSDRDKTISLFDTESERELRSFRHNSFYSVSSISFSPDGETLASADNTVILWNVETGKEVEKLESVTGTIFSTAVSPTGQILALSDTNEKIHIWDLVTGRKMHTLDVQEKIVGELKFSPDEKQLVSVIWRTNLIKVWDVGSGKLLHTLKLPPRHWAGTIDISPDSRKLVTISAIEDEYPETTVQIWNLESGKSEKVLAKETKISDTEKNYYPTFSKDGTKVITGTLDGTITVWDVETGKKLQTFSADIDRSAVQAEIELIAPEFFELITPKPLLSNSRLPKEKYFFTSSNGNRFRIEKSVDHKKLLLYPADSQKALASFLSLTNGNWVIVTPEGLFDASPEARKLIHYTIGMETVSLEQIKDVYYVPGLLRKILAGEPLPDVELFSAKDLFPLAEYDLPKNGEKEFPVKITNRGSGIGQVQIFVNGKEFLSDARPAGFDPNQTSAIFNIDLKDAPLIEGSENRIEIVTRNPEGSISSRGTPRGRETLLSKNTGSNLPPNVYIIAGGISNYTGDNLDLKFAAKDAASFARAIEIGASNLFGADKVHLRLLTSDFANANIDFQSKDAKVLSATKADFVRAFNDFKIAQPNDIFIVYLAGHGISLSSNQTNTDTYLYLTQEATTNDKTVLAVEISRKAMTISSDELTDLIKQNKALKQVLILDTCAAGAAAHSLIAQRDLPSDQIRAIERLKDRTGFFVLMGAAANKVSYEATQYGQGLLTYALMQGLKGAKLRENQFADVNLLFSYAQDTVPQMAKYIGGIQQPLIISPDASESFDIGRFTSEEQKEIQLSAPKPLILKPVLQNNVLFYDDQELTSLLAKELRNASFRVDPETFQTPLVFVEADEMTDAIKPSGSYTVTGEDISVTIILVKNKKPVRTFKVNGKINAKEQLVGKIVDEITKALRN